MGRRFLLELHFCRKSLSIRSCNIYLLQRATDGLYSSFYYNLKSLSYTFGELFPQSFSKRLFLFCLISVFEQQRLCEVTQKVNKSNAKIIGTIFNPESLMFAICLYFVLTVWCRYGLGPFFHARGFIPPNENASLIQKCSTAPLNKTYNLRYQLCLYALYVKIFSLCLVCTVHH